MITKSESIRCL